MIVFHAIQLVSVSMVSPGGSYVQPTYIIPALRADNIPDVPLKVYPPTQPPSTWPCPLCRESFRRWQDRNRHIQSHLPYWIGCSYDACSWRGYRIDIFRKHWHNEHQSTNQVPDESGSKLYDPMPLVDDIVRGSVSIEDAENWAIERIKKIAAVLDKQALLTDPCGRKEKNFKLKGSRKYPRFAETNTLLPTGIASTPTYSSVPPTKLWVSAPVVARDPYTEAENGPQFLRQDYMLSSFGITTGTAPLNHPTDE
jgi:hypothetical protein